MRTILALGSVMLLARGASAAPAATVKSSTPLDTLLVPQVRVGDSFSYRGTDRFTGSFNHTHRDSVTYTITSTHDGVISFRLTAAGEPDVALQRDASGAVIGPKNATPDVSFVISRRVLGGPPNPLTAGSTWSAPILVETIFGFPGVATVTASSVDRQSGHLTLQVALKGEGDSESTASGDDVHYHTKTDRHATIELTNGIVDSWTIAGNDEQSWNGRRPNDFHIVMNVQRTK